MSGWATHPELVCFPLRQIPLLIVKQFFEIHVIHAVTYEGVSVSVNDLAPLNIPAVTFKKMVVSEFAGRLIGAYAVPMASLQTVTVSPGDTPDTAQLKVCAHVSTFLTSIGM